MKSEGEFILVTTTTPDEGTARDIADSLVESRLSACVQVVGPISSTYRWQGQVEKAQEWLCLIKARASDLERVEEAIKAKHPYEVPEIIALPVVGGSRDYLEWLGTGTSPEAPG